MMECKSGYNLYFPKNKFGKIVLIFFYFKHEKKTYLSSIKSIQHDGMQKWFGDSSPRMLS
jgi:hypothetical protein